jgi:hypothetical protein
MTGKNSMPQQCRAIGLCVIIAICLQVLVGCVLLCGVAWFAVAWVSDLEVVEDGEILVHKEVAIDPGFLPEHPTERDWYQITAQLLEDHGWDLAPNLSGLHGFVPCQSYPEPDRFYLDVAYAYFDGVVPYLKWASVSFDRNANTASVWIEHQALRWRHDTLDLSKIEVGLYEALEIADRYGGQDFRESVNNECLVGIWLGDAEWEIDYAELGPVIWSEEGILVDFRTGEARRVDR